jgi:hypothetical protein
MNMKIAVGAGSAALALVVFGLVTGGGAAGRTEIAGYDPYVLGMSQKIILAAEPQFHAATPPEWLRKLGAVMYEREGTVTLGSSTLPQPATIRLGFVESHLAFIGIDLRGQPAYQPGTPASAQNNLWHAVRSAIMEAYSSSLISLDDQADGHERMVLHDVWGDSLRANHVGDGVSVQYLIDWLAHAIGIGM